MLVTWVDLPRSPGHAFYDRLQEELVDAHSAFRHLPSTIR
jgi:hypothetical protein